jgi:hypothetical protein
VAIKGVPDSRPPARIVDRVEAAEHLVRRGINVVLVIDPDAGAAALPTGGPGRVAIMVGRLDDPIVRASAQEMAAELF